ncbi:polysaccharide lyase family 8 super-sandwich domain-containing protein [Algoriphagus namhaensis]|uniref:Polysaccharide lyase family 8 super-sandwich domain-containing protein n=1 Tax=Algoriphagus namhaensis TaxID=915353 RepID=A0ABV8ARL8_9BACT
MKSFSFFFACCLTLFVSPLFAQQEDFKVIEGRIFSEYHSQYNTGAADKESSNYLASMADNGSWPDLNYASKSMTGWPADKHLKRLGIISRSYIKSKSKYFQDPEVHAKIVKGLEYWTSLSPEPTSDNWWWTSISVPKEVGGILILMRRGKEGICKPLENKMLEWMNKYVSIYKTPGSDGSNLTDIAQHMIMQAVLTENSDLLKEAVDVTSKSIKISNGEGIQRDFSFHAHGPELYIHGYGREYLLGIRNVAVYVKDTQFEFSKDQIALISNFMRKGYLNVIRGKYIDYAVIGRGIARSNNTRTNASLVEQIRDIDIDEHRAEYDQAIARINEDADPGAGVKPSNTNYWRSDYMVHNRPEFMVSVNNASSRSIRTESGNGENLKGHWLTEGAMFIAMRGNEYYNIFPNWQWYRIPGTTTPENKNLKKRTNWHAKSGNASFVGGVSDGLNGVSVYKMNDYETKAQKSWFFFDDIIVCLGTGIFGDRSEKIGTTLNQVHLRGDVWVAKDSNFDKIPKGLQEYKDGVKWVYHDGVGYYFPSAQNVVLSAQVQKGSWSEINSNSSAKTIEAEIFNLWIDHGSNPKYKSYEYMLTPGVADYQTASSKPVDKIKILSNKTFAQVVKDERKDLYGMVFYEKASFEWDNNKVSVNQPSLIQLQRVDEKTWKIHAAEPTQTLKGNLVVSIRLEGVDKTVTFKLPEGDLAGSTVSQTVEF